jgi:hypothetical protein
LPEIGNDAFLFTLCVDLQINLNNKSIMTLPNKRQTISALIIASLSITFNAGAQKLPKVQTTNLRAPSNIKIDGKATEWNNKFQAYNTATNLYYTIANNTDFVYFTAHVQDRAVIDRITKNGFTFEAYKNENSKKDLISITVPPTTNKNFSFNLSKPINDNASLELEKAVMIANNTALQKYHKLIVVKGVAGIDTLSIYDDQVGVKFAEAFDSNEDYTLELQLPVKFIQSLQGDNLKFSYHFTINGLPGLNSTEPIGVMSVSNGTMTPVAPQNVTPEMQAAVNEITTRIAMKYAPTDFRADYTLIKE